MKFSIIPHKGIGLIHLGMDRDDVMNTLGEHNFDQSHGNSDYYFQSALQIEFENDKVDFIGVSFSPLFDLEYEGKNLFSLNANEVFSLISGNESSKHNFIESEYIFPDQIITLWDADYQYDYKNSHTQKAWGQIGLGSQNYFQAIQKLSSV